MSTLRVSQYRDIVDELSAKLQKSGPIFESALDEALHLHVKGFKLVGDTFVYEETQEPLDEWVLKYRETHAHCYADRAPSGDEIEASAIHDALTQPTPGKLAALHKAIGPMRFNKLIKDWGVDVARMKPGTPPEYATDGKTVVQRKAGDKNPWSSKSWNISAQGACVKALGVEKASAIARAAGCRIGDTKPNPVFN